MGIRDERIDSYIANAAPFAQPILRHVRDRVHEACPDIEETIKWGMPHFERGGILCSMAAFREHCALTFWNAPEVVGAAAVDGAMGQFGRIRTVEDLPSDAEIREYVRKARALREAGVSATVSPRGSRPAPAVPDALARALEADASAAAEWEQFSPSQKRDYVEWITEAKRESTRHRRLEQALEWISQGKPRNWKYR